MRCPVQVLTAAGITIGGLADGNKVPFFIGYFGGGHENTPASGTFASYCPYGSGRCPTGIAGSEGECQSFSDVARYRAVAPGHGTGVIDHCGQHAAMETAMEIQMLGSDFQSQDHLIVFPFSDTKADIFQKSIAAALIVCLEICSRSKFTLRSRGYVGGRGRPLSLPVRG